MKVKEKTIEEKYSSLTEIEHILKRRTMYIGSDREELTSLFIYDQDDCKMKITELSYTPGLLKLLDEMISNVGDEFRRKDNMGLTDIEVEIHRNGHCKIKDNGGIPVVKHKETNLYVPSMIFGQLRTSSNYNDNEERDVIGTNGLGSKIVVIFSKYFSVYTADNKKSFFQAWKNNMQETNDKDIVIKNCNEHFTEFQFDIDWNHFEDVKEITNDFVLLIEKRIIDLCAANPGLNAKFTFIDNDNTILRNVEWKFKSFEEYIELYNDFIDQDNVISFKDKQKQVWIYPDGGLNIGFVNGAECSKGTHIKAIRNEINNSIATYILQKNKIDVGSRNVDGKYTMFCVYHIANPAYSSQTKEELTTAVEHFSMEKDYKFSIPDKFIKECCKSEIVNIVIDWFKQKSEVEDQKTLRKLNKQLKAKVRSDKFIDSNTKVKSDKELWLFEGQSAAANMRPSRNPQTQGAYLLRGKVLNTQGLPISKISANQELSDLMSIIGLQFGEKALKENILVGKIILAQDADVDGSSIASLLINFFNIFPELFEYNMIYRVISPIVIAKKGKEKKYYYTLDEYKKAESSLKGYKMLYIKGLGSLEKDDFKEMMQNPKLILITKDDLADLNLKNWFGKANASIRKGMLKNDVE